MSWYNIENINKIDSPALVVYPSRVKTNIDHLTGIVSDIENLRPHVKTNKTAEICMLMMERGIRKFKCATIAEAEMLALIKAPDVLLAYPPIGPKAHRLLQLVQTYPHTHFSCIADDIHCAGTLSELCIANGLILDVYIDLNTGMNRTGIRPAHALQLFEIFDALQGIHIAGLHAYDGHIRHNNPVKRKEACDEVFLQVQHLCDAIKLLTGRTLKIVAGGSPTFMIHAQRQHVECSPGTFVFWDWGYHTLLPDLHFVFAALVIARIISIPDAETICTDLGHKSIAAESPFPRVHFLNLPGAIHAGQSEEHLTLKVPDASLFAVGDVLYGVPVHICPTVALYEKMWIVENKKITGSWRITARDRAIHI